MGMVIAQETPPRAWRRHGDLEREEHVRAWLNTIATSACLDAIKAKGGRVRAGRFAGITRFGAKHLPAFGLAPILP